MVMANEALTNGDAQNLMHVVLNAVQDALKPRLLNAAYVYGSASTPHFNVNSDIDVAIDVGYVLSPTERWEAAQAIAAALDRDIDLVDFRSANAVLRHQILTTGRRIFARDLTAQLTYEAAVLSEYMDFVEQRQPLMNDILSRGSVYAR
jgi:uncharacterized protein